jgi:hypothetical protein
MNIHFSSCPTVQAAIFRFQTSTMQFTFLLLLSPENTGETAFSYQSLVFTVKFPTQ